MSDYTPTTNEVRMAYGDARCIDTAADHGLGCPSDAEFDRWLTVHDAQVRADALEEAADEYRSGQLTGIFMSRDDYPRQWLRARAATIRETGQ